MLSTLKILVTVLYTTILDDVKRLGTELVSLNGTTLKKCASFISNPILFSLSSHSVADWTHVLRSYNALIQVFVHFD